MLHRISFSFLPAAPPRFWSFSFHSCHHAATLNVLEQLMLASISRKDGASGPKVEFYSAPYYQHICPTLLNHIATESNFKPATHLSTKCCLKDFFFR